MDPEYALHGAAGCDGHICSTNRCRAAHNCSGQGMIFCTKRYPTAPGWSCRPNGALRAALLFGYCRPILTESYESNISVYEKGLKYAMGYTNLSGNGTRIAMTLRFKISDKFAVQHEATRWIYYDRDEIGSSRQRIESSHKEDINLQLTWNF